MAYDDYISRGELMRTYGQYCPMAKAVEILGDRWTLLIVRDLLTGARHFNDLGRGLPGISRALLAGRLRHLERTGIITRHEAGRGRPTEYQLTQAGQELQPLVNLLVSWGARWAFGDPDPADLDPLLMMWWLRGGVQRDRLPPGRVVVQFDFQGARAATYWLLLDRRDVSVCLHDPGFGNDLVVTADIAAWYRVWLGRTTLAAAMRADLVRFSGPPALIRAFARWWTWSPAAGAVRATVAAPADQGRPARAG
jgi:DNA-binding HxlR family transcriptional regulator